MKSQILAAIDPQYLINYRKIGASLAVTGLALGVSFALAKTGVASTVSPALPALVFSGLFGGIVPALLSALIISVYTHLLLPSDLLARVLVVNLSYLGTALLIAYYHVQIRQHDTLNGNIDRLKLAIQAEDNNLGIVKNLLDRWDDYTADGHRNQVRQLWMAMSDNRHHLAHLAALVFGWHAIRREMDETQRRAETPAGGRVEK